MCPGQRTEIAQSPEPQMRHQLGITEASLALTEQAPLLLT